MMRSAATSTRSPRLLVRLGRPEEAEPFARGALEGPEADTLAARSERLAVDGRPALRYRPRRRSRALGPRAPGRAGERPRGARHGIPRPRPPYLAAVLTAQERAEEAEEVLRQAIDVLGACLGPDHPVRAGLILWIANLHQKRDDLAGAEALCREALDIQVRSLGGDDPEVAGTLMRLGLLLDRAERSEEAVGVLRQSLAILTGKLDCARPRARRGPRLPGRRAQRARARQ